jgi:predicted metal-dependent hydrolase
VATRKRLAWLQNTLQEFERHAAPKGSFRERKRPHKFSSYVALMSNIIDSEPSTFKKVVENLEWKDAMMEEYQSIMKNDVWEFVLRPEGKLDVTSKWIYKIKHVAHCYRTVCSLGQRLKDRGQTGITGTFPTQCHHDEEVLSI